MFSNYFDYVELAGTGANAQAVFRNYWGIGIIKPFSTEIRHTLAECESMLKTLESRTDTDARRSQQAFTVAAQRLRDARA